MLQQQDSSSGGDHKKTMSVENNKNVADVRPPDGSLVMPDKFSGKKVFVFVEIENIYDLKCSLITANDITRRSLPCPLRQKVVIHIPKRP